MTPQDKNYVVQNKDTILPLKSPLLIVTKRNMEIEMLQEWNDMNMHPRQVKAQVQKNLTKSTKARKNRETQLPLKWRKSHLKPINVL